MGALARDAELVGDLGLSAALGEQLGRLQPSGLKGGTLLGRVRAAGRRHRRTSHATSPAVNPTHETQIDVVLFQLAGYGGSTVPLASLMTGRALTTR
jgi:hypothetical protein